MAEQPITDIQLAMVQRLLWTITLWNRLEARPRTHDFNRTLKAEVRDALWMLTRQWQMGEFQGDDAGSPIFAKIHMDTSPLDGYQASTYPAQPYNRQLPLETQVEQRPIPFHRGTQPIALDIRLLMGRQWLKLIAPVGNFRDDFIARYGINTPDPSLEADVEICSDNATWQMVSAVAQNAMDGYKLYVYLIDDDNNHAYDGIPIPAVNHTTVEGIEAQFIAWYERLFTQPGRSQGNAWIPDQLEYQFAVSAEDASGSDVLKAEEYYHGQLDWYNLDIDPQRNDLEITQSADGEENNGDLPRPTQSFIPTAMDFEGMPNTRWWQFEDGRTSFGNLNPGTKDIAQLMLMEFGLIYANDWFLFPLTLPVGTTTRIKGLAVTNVFGERIWIEAAGRGQDEDWQRWNMYTHAVYGDDDVRADTRATLLPTVSKIQEGDPFESVTFIRDEMANMVWGIETHIAMVDGRPVPGFEASVRLKQLIQQILGGGTITPPPAVAALRYKVMSNNVPENWIPFIPVHEAKGSREIRLQRAALPRIIEGSDTRPEKVRPRTALLRDELDAGKPYYLNEEEVTRAGTHIYQSFQRTRWHHGEVITWVGVRKQTGRGEGLSNLRFDYLEPTDYVPVEDDSPSN